MYSSLGIVKNSKHSGALIGTHQKIDRVARHLFNKHAPRGTYFPSIKEILYFEGMQGPDGLKRKSPGKDEPVHFIYAKNDDGHLIKLLLNHQYNLRVALQKKDSVRASFEAAWMAHAIADGLTPAHHYPYTEVVDELMVDLNYKKIFGVQIKGIMRGHNIFEATRNNWLYWGVEGVMTKHIAYEYGVAYAVAATKEAALMPKIEGKLDPAKLDFKKEFYKSFEKINQYHMYERFLKEDWTTQLAIEAKQVLVPEVVKMITIGWLSSLPQKEKQLKAKK